MSKKLDWALLFAGVLLGLLVLLATANRDTRPEEATIYFRSGALANSESLAVVQRHIADLEGVHSAEITDQGRMLKVIMNPRRVEPATIRELIGCHEQESDCRINDIMTPVNH